MESKNKDYYQKLREKFRLWMQSEEGKNNKWSELLMAAPDLFHLLCKLSLDKDVPARERVKIAGAITYFMTPLDIVPEIILGPIGYVDDIAIAAYVINHLVNNTNPEIVRKHWAGDGDILELIKKILNVADKMVGSGMWSKIKKRFK